jgi:chemosensory pili system protein ChpA (sensor histidine kinase/response regulator)
MPKRIAVVDDEECLCDLMKLALVSRGYEVECALDGKAGKELVERIHPDLAIIDIQMPRMNGYELATQLRQNTRTRGIPILILTSITDGSGKSDEHWRESMGVDGFLSKPVDLELLLDRIGELVGNP